ncbi:hypothetical protein QJR26_07045 [Clostridium baratii]
MPRKDNSLLETLFSKKEKEGLEKGISDERIKPTEYNLITLGKKGYEILTREQYIERELCETEAFEQSKEFIDKLNKNWYILSKGYEFVVMANDMYYSVDYFNENILKGVKEKKDKKEAMTLTVGLNVEDLKEITSRIEEMARLEKSLNQLKDNLGYVILTREQYATKNFEKTGELVTEGRIIPHFKTISDEEWERISGGKNFVVMVKGEVCSLAFFEKNILGIDE